MYNSLMKLSITAIVHYAYSIIFLYHVECNVPYYNQPPILKQPPPNLHHPPSSSYRQTNQNAQVLSYGSVNPIGPSHLPFSETQDPGIPPGLTLGDPDLLNITQHRATGTGTIATGTTATNTNPIQTNQQSTLFQHEIQSKTSMRDQIVNLIMSKYRSYERPPDPGGNATIVTVNMKILAIFSIDVRTMDYYVDLLLRQVWRDQRLSWYQIPKFANFTEPLVSPKLKEQLWLPDLFFRNGKDGYLHKLTLPNYLLRVHPNGQVLYSQKITMRFSCQMHLQTFPMDKQHCHINIGSYGYTLNELKFIWNHEKPVELAEKLQLSEFETPQKFDTNDCSSGYSTSTGQYTCLNATFELQRQLGSYLATTYIPNILIIMVSWLSFWVNVDSAPARVPLGLLSLLGILTQAISVSSTLPRVSYIKAIDIWMIFSIIFVIGVLVEYAIALTLLRRKQSETWHEDVKEIVREELTRWCTICQQQQLIQLQQQQQQQNKQNFLKGQFEFREELEQLLTSQLIDENKKIHQSKSSKCPPGLIESEIDTYSRFLFPACFVLYNCFYWCYFLIIVNQI
ncbi:unnamed protein product [Schistosoma turkestanicum]|nr:unnamed protein product [Schistosoma turkestanicum]